jgi:hypothetical protein
LPLRRDEVIIVVTTFKDLILERLSFSQLNVALPRKDSDDPLTLLIKGLQDYLQPTEIAIVGLVVL